MLIHISNVYCECVVHFTEVIKRSRNIHILGSTFGLRFDLVFISILCVSYDYGTMHTAVGLVFWLVASLISRSFGKNVMKDEQVVTEDRGRCQWRNHFMKVTANGSGLCSLCKRCPAGQSIQHRCTRQNDTVCKDCPAGYFSPEGAKHCHRCHRFCPAGTEIINNCTASSNIECRPCKNGTYARRNSECTPCKQVCPRGTYVKSKCTSKKDTVCSPCPRGTYFNEPNINNFCESCHYCGYGRETIHLCTRKSDSVCGGCKEGFFWNPVSLGCEKCNTCFPDLAIIQRVECQLKTSDQSELCAITSTTISENLSLKDNNIHYSHVRVTSGDKTIIIIVISTFVAIITVFIILCIVVKVINNKRNNSTSGVDSRKQKNQFKTFKTEEDASSKIPSKIFSLFTQNDHQLADNIRMSCSAPCIKCPLDSEFSPYRYSYPTNDYHVEDYHTCPRDLNTDAESRTSDTNIMSVSLSCFHAHKTVSNNTNQDTCSKVDSNSCSTNPGFTIESIDDKITPANENQNETRQGDCHNYRPGKPFQSYCMEHHFLQII